MAKKKTKTDSYNDLMDQLSKNHEAVYRARDVPRPVKQSTGSIVLDRELGGGYVRGKMIEIYGPESVGKSALCYRFLSKIPGIKAFIDAESAYDRDIAEMYEVDISNMIIQKPTYAEAGMELMLDLANKGTVDAIVYDSIAGLAPKDEMESSMSDHSVGKKAYRMGQLMRKLHTAADKNQCTCLFVNQIRDGMSMFNPVETPGGKALRFQASYRLWITSTSNIEIRKGESIGHDMNIKIKKNKYGPPGGKVSVPLIWGQGVSREWEIMTIALVDGIITKNGSWFAYEGSTLAQGEGNLYCFLLDNPEFVTELQIKLGI